MEPGEEDIGADIAEDDESEHLCNASEESVDIVEHVAGSAVVAVDMREIFVAARSAADISEFFLSVAGEAEPSLLSLGEESGFLAGRPFAHDVASAVRLFEHFAAGEAGLIVNAGRRLAGLVSDRVKSLRSAYLSAIHALADSLAGIYTGRLKGCYPRALGVTRRGNDLLGKGNSAGLALLNFKPRFTAGGLLLGDEGAGLVTEGGDFFFSDNNAAILALNDVHAVNGAGRDDLDLCAALFVTRGGDCLGPDGLIASAAVPDLFALAVAGGFSLNYRVCILGVAEGVKSFGFAYFAAINAFAYLFAGVNAGGLADGYPCAVGVTGSGNGLLLEGHAAGLALADSAPDLGAGGVLNGLPFADGVDVLSLPDGVESHLTVSLGGEPVDGFACRIAVA